jgi:hypothetical protein
MLPQKRNAPTMPVKQKPFLLLELPEELLQVVLDYLPRSALKQLNFASKACRDKATPHIWREVELVDCRTNPESNGRPIYANNSYLNAQRIPAGAQVLGDEHDDGPLIKKLLVLATQPWIAASVHTLTHRCHLPPPSIFNELPRTTFAAQTLSCDPRTIMLVRLAVRNMKKLHTLRIVFGHEKLTEALIRCCFDAGREFETPVRKCWLENVRLNECLEVSIESHKYGLPLKLDFSGLESLWLRRVPMELKHLTQEERISNRAYISFSRGGTSTELQNGLGGHYLTTINTQGVEVITGHEQLDTFRQADGGFETGEWPVEKLFKESNQYDDKIYNALLKKFPMASMPTEVRQSMVPNHRQRSMLAYRDSWPRVKDVPKEEANRARELFRSSVPVAARSTMSMLQMVAPTLTSLTLDWLIMSPPNRANDNGSQRMVWFRELFDLRFPNLYVFQFRNACVPETALPPGLYLFDPSSVTINGKYRCIRTE